MIFRTTSNRLSEPFFTTVGEMVPVRPNMRGVIPEEYRAEFELISTAANENRIFWTWKVKVFNGDVEIMDLR